MTRWYVVHARPHQEQRAKVNLARQGYRVWLPMMQRSRRRAKRFEIGHAPLFPGYLFVELDIGREPWRAINGTFGVKRLLADGPLPQALPEDFVAALREATGDDGVSTPEPVDLKPGDAVTIAAGPFVECAAVVLRLAPRERVEVLLDVLGGRVPARLPKRAVIAAA
ncbi:MAG: transcriptional activator RfaH [Rhodospirillales bacterium]|nr:transcriptional activator RfaH [Rhodospirillales bacterium]